MKFFPFAALAAGILCLSWPQHEVAAQGAIGGRGFALTSRGNSQVLLTWQAGTAQASYRLTRFTSAGPTVLPAPAPSATSAQDTLPAGTTVACYQLEALAANGATLGFSDLLCLVSRIATGQAPGNLTLQLNQSPIATVTWDAVAGATNYLLLALGTQRVQVLTGTTAVDDTGGAVACYLVVARADTSLLGFSDVVCALPGLSTLPGGPSPATSTPAALPPSSTPTGTGTSVVVITATSTSVGATATNTPFVPTATPFVPPTILTNTPVIIPTFPPAPTGVPPSGGPLGRAFSLTVRGVGSVLLTWQGGTGEPVVFRTTSTGDVQIPVASPTSAVDQLPSNVRVGCYRVVAMSGSAVLANSDLLCLVSRVATGQAPANLTLQLNQSPIASLSWDVVPGATSYVFVPLGTQRLQIVTATSAVDDTGGAATCYLVAARTDASVLGFTDVVCGLPGLSSLPSGTTPPTSTPGLFVPTSTPTVPPTSTPTVPPTSTATGTATVTAPGTPVATAASTTVPTATSTLAVSPTFTSTPEVTATATPSPTGPTSTAIATPAVSATPTETVEPTPLPTVAPINIAEGVWTGTTSQGRPITFVVQGRSITSITVGYTGSGCGLQLNETSQSDFAEPVAITPDNQFFASMPPPETLAGVGFVNGTFSAPKAASGRINFVILLISGFPCAINVDATWTATHP